MKKILTLSFIALLFIFACDDEKDEENKQDPVAEIDSSQFNDLQSEDTNSTIKPIELPDFIYKDRTYDICYIKAGELYFYSIEDNVSDRFTDDSQIEHAVFSDDKKTMYYTAHKNNTLWLKKAVFSDSEHQSYWLTDMERTISKFETETYGEKGRFLFYNDSLFLECEYSWMEGFIKMALYDIKNMKLSIPENSIYGINSKLNQANVKNVQFIAKQIKSQETKGTYELFYKEGNQRIQLSHTQVFDEEILINNEEYEENPTMKEYTKDFNFKVSPDSSKVLFSLMTGMGDLAHGPFFIVNIDGTKQNQLNFDGISSEFDPIWVNGSSVVFLREEDEKNETPAGLYLTNKKNNYLIFIDTEVDYYLKI